MEPLGLWDLLACLDGRGLKRPPETDAGIWAGFFEGDVHITAARILDREVLFTLSIPTAPGDIWDFIHTDEAAAGTTAKVRFTQSGRPIALRGLGIERTGPPPQWDVPGPDGYRLRVALTADDNAPDTREPIVFEIVSGDASDITLATAVGLAPVREELRELLMTSVISLPLLEQLRHAGNDEQFDVVIDVNLAAGQTRDEALARVRELISQIRGDGAGNPDDSANGTEQYVFERLTRAQIEALVRSDQGSLESGIQDLPKARRERSIYRVWPDFPVHALLDHSIPTIKADAARKAFSASGHGITWAVIDSGIETHGHFARHANLVLDDPQIEHQDFITGKHGHDALRDDYGHGTHVAGIIAGEQAEGTTEYAGVRERNEVGGLAVKQRPVIGLRGVAPECKLVSLRVLDETGNGPVTRIMQALDYVNQVNNYGRDLRIHGVNLSVGYEFDAQWFACGQSPLCIEVNRLVSTGVVVVVAAGNTGYGQVSALARPTNVGMDVTINDPGNAEQAITVGATHGEMPHTYGVSFFSSKGPTGDGRLKPDLIAPGERIVSCAAGSQGRLPGDPDTPAPRYIEDSGTSMAAPHVSGAAAAFLSIRSEFIGQPDRVKRLFMDTATDLGRARYFQGSGMLDLMRAIQAV